MNIVQLKDVATVLYGEIPSRLITRYGKGISFYDQSSFEEDMNYIKKQTIKTIYNEEIIDEGDSIRNLLHNEGDLIISNSSEKAVVGSPLNVGKVYTLNFAKISLDLSKVYPDYFIYVFNESSSIKRQLEKNRQGSSGIKRLTLRNLENLEIPVRDAETHQKIGQAYKELLELEKNLEEYKSGMKIVVKSLLEKEIN